MFFVSGPGHGATIVSPLDIPGHVLWLDGDDFDGNGSPDTGNNGDALLTWVDKSSGQGDNSVSVTAGAPTKQFSVVGTHNAAEFIGGSQDKLDNATFNVSADYTVFTVIQADDFAASGHVLSGLNTTATDAVLYRNGAGGYRFYSGVDTGGTDLQIAQQTGATPLRLFGYQINSTGSDLGLFQNKQVTLEWNGPATLDGIRIGNLDRATPSSTDRPEAFSGKIAQVIIYNRVLTSSEIDDVSTYLNTRFDLGFVQPPPDRMTQTETGHVTPGVPSFLDPSSEPVVSGRSNGALSSKGGLAFAKDFIGPGNPRDFRPYRANDGLYADVEEGPPPTEEPWIGGSLNTFFGVKLSGPMTIDRIGIQDEFANRRNGTLTFQYTLDNLDAVPGDFDLGLDPTAIDAKNWQLLDIEDIQDGADTRHLFSFAPIAGVTGVRVVIDSSGAAEFAISEFEVWTIPEPTIGSLVCAGAWLLGAKRRRM